MKIKKVADNLIRTVTLMIVLTIVAKVLGFVREMVIADAFGTSYVVDAYVMAQSIPEVLLGGIFCAIGTAYTPIYSQLQETKGDEGGNKFTNQTVTLSTILSIIVCFFGIIFSDQLVTIFARNFSPETVLLTSFYLKVAFSYAIFSCTVSTLTSFLQYKGRFLAPIIGGYFYNFGIIIVSIASAKMGAHLLAFGMQLGYLLNMLFLYGASRREGYYFQLDFSFDSSIHQIFHLAIPAFLSVSMYNINTFVDRTLASSLSEGCVAALNYASTLIRLIMGLTITVIITIVYPKLAKAINQTELDTSRFLIEKSITVIAILAVPFCLGSLAFSEELVQIVYERGSFNESSTRLTASAFAYYAIGILFAGIGELYSRIYYSLQEMKPLLVCSAISIVANVGLNLFLVGSMQHQGLALATSLATTVNAVTLGVALHRHHPEIAPSFDGGKLICILLSAGIAVGTAVLVQRLLLQIWMPRFIRLGISVLSAVPTYLVLLTLLKVDEVSLLKKFR